MVLTFLASSLGTVSTTPKSPASEYDTLNPAAANGPMLPIALPKTELSAPHLVTGPQPSAGIEKQ